MSALTTVEDRPSPAYYISFPKIRFGEETFINTLSNSNDDNSLNHGIDKWYGSLYQVSDTSAPFLGVGAYPIDDLPTRDMLYAVYWDSTSSTLRAVKSKGYF